jgi:hypothetical protein
MAKSTIQKGKANEAKTEAYLKGLGYEVFTPPKSRFGKQDILGLFDHVATWTQDKEPPIIRANYYVEIGLTKWEVERVSENDALAGLPTILFVQTKSRYNLTTEYLKELCAKVPYRNISMFIAWENGKEEPKIAVIQKVREL